ncbi:Uncharacterised protein [Bordetella pertussis]|uniref:DUF6817 domain-containing protein n=1 Tax=Bordetella pertussis TaxID=520 RepID=UPI0005E0D842|nr:hypothetical protein [Bordetella pertussis]CFT89988.1 Uncharacterised protein [Bordetella pertussis]CPJ43968.1 Uncharacterised protein [Bordetella pertussis]CPM16742.1 Uncharacterised protein [Bordetella pertussis]
MSSSADLHPHARALLADHYAAIDADLPALLELLFARSAGEDWHKAGTFKHHLLGVYRTLALWNQPREVRLLGLFHSVYGNEYVDLTLFDRERERATLRQYLGEEAEQWVHLFCAMPRTQFVQRILAGEGRGATGLVLQGADGQPLTLTPRQVAAFIVVSAADVGEQWHSWQDEIFAGYPHQERRDTSTHWAASLWPGPLKPPARILDMLSRLLQPLSTLPAGTGIPTPPAFGHCTAVLDAGDEAAAAALYWQGITRMHPMTEMDSAHHLLQAAIAHNPWVAEPRLLLAQLALTAQDYDTALEQAAAGLAALQAWGTSWDKRIEWSGWMAWARILLQNARDRQWPATLGGLNGLGLMG